MRRSQAGEPAVAHHDGCDLRACGTAARGQIVGAVARDAGDETVADGLISGVGENGVSYLRPEGCATRAQVATILMNYDKALG